ncbi:hypothetical protein QYE76_050034 [Lolium multiflorum]|uniref:Reverse transcriptase domain-containing protein n=1 Tax=Lolium multiflorum TaxID=4521 RepID=A0AAD8SQB1_LOLMU|nr:hypothetical protein QYE76_050034 [Lolium multiflorum]
MDARQSSTSPTARPPEPGSDPTRPRPNRLARPRLDAGSRRGDHRGDSGGDSRRARQRLTERRGRAASGSSPPATRFRALLSPPPWWFSSMVPAEFGWGTAAPPAAPLLLSGPSSLLPVVRFSSLLPREFDNMAPNEAPKEAMFQMRFGSKRLAKVVQKNMNGAKRAIIAKTAFKPLLKVASFAAPPMELIEYVVKHTNPKLREFRHKNKSILFTREMVVKVLGVPSGNRDLVYLKRTQQSDLRDMFKNEKGRATIAKAIQVLENCEDTNEALVVQSFGLIAFATVLCPGTGNLVRCEYLGILMNANEIGQYAIDEHILKETMGETIYMDFLSFPPLAPKEHTINRNTPRFCHVCDDDFKLVVDIDKNKLSLDPASFGVRPLLPLSQTLYVVVAPTDGNLPHVDPGVVGDDGLGSEEVDVNPSASLNEWLEKGFASSEELQGYSRLWAENTREKSSPAGMPEIPPEGEIDAIAIVIERDIISIIIIIISTIYTAITTAAPHKTLLDTSCSGSFTRKNEEFKRDLLDRIQENTEGWENDKDRESGITYDYKCIEAFMDTDKFRNMSATYGLDSQVVANLYRAFASHYELPKKNFDKYHEPYKDKIDSSVNKCVVVETVDNVIPEAYISFPAKMKEYSVISSAVNKSEKKPKEPEEQIKIEPAVAIVKDLVTENVEDGHIIFCEDASNIVSHPNKSKQVSVPMLSVRIGDHCYYGLCDIGASVSAIPYELYTEIMHEIGSCELEDIDVVIHLANRETISPIGIVRDVEVLCGKIKYPVDFLQHLENSESEAFRKERDELEEIFRRQPILKHDLPVEDLGTTPPPKEDPVFDLKPLPDNLKYAHIDDKKIYPVIISSKLSEIEEERLLEILKKHRGAIGYTLDDLKGISPSICQHAINMEDDAKPVVEHQRRLIPKMKEVVRNEVLKLLEAGIIYPIADSRWVSPVHCVPKKGGMTVVPNDNDELIPQRIVVGYRMCIDFRKVNKVTKKDHYPLPFIDQMLERLSKNTHFCFLDGYSGFSQIAVKAKDQEKTTFTCPYGTYAYRRMPFGLCNAPATFQRCMSAIFHGFCESIVEVFMDDFSVYGNSFDNCLRNLDKVLQRCEETNLVLNWEKCHFMVNEGIVLGHKISERGIEVDRAKVEAIEKMPYPRDVKGIRSVLGHAGFYRRFIKDFSKISKPLTNLLQKDKALTTAPVVEPPDWNLPFEIMCDASDFAVGAVLGQRVDKKLNVIHYANRKGADNPVAYNLSRLENIAYDPVPVNDSFPNEQLAVIKGALPPALDLDSFPCVEEAIRVADEFCDQYSALRREVEILRRRTSDFAECWNITQIPAQGRHRHTRGYSRLCGAENTREKRALPGGIRRGNSLPEGEIDAIAIVIERDIISIIIIISTIYTAITTAAPLSEERAVPMPVRIVLLPGVALLPLLIVIMPTMSSVVSGQTASLIIVAVSPALIYTY